MDNTRLPKHALTTNLEEEEIVDAPGNDGNASIPETVKRPNPWRKMMMMISSVVQSNTFIVQIMLTTLKNVVIKIF